MGHCLPSGGLASSNNPKILIKLLFTKHTHHATKTRPTFEHFSQIPCSQPSTTGTSSIPSINKYLSVSPISAIQNRNPPVGVTQGPTLTASLAPNLALELAIRKHLDGLPEAEKDAFREASKTITQDNLLATVHAYDGDHKRSSSFRPQAERLSKLLNLLNRFMAGVCTTIQANPDPSSIIVSAVRVVISLTVEFVTSFDRLIDMLCRFADYLGPLAEYSKVLTDSDLIRKRSLQRFTLCFHR